MGISEADFKCFLWMLVSFADSAARLLAWRIRLPGQAGRLTSDSSPALGKARATARQGGACVPQGLQQLIRIDVDGDGDVFGEWQFVEGFAHEPAQAHDGFAADQNVKAELAL